MDRCKHNQWRTLKSASSKTMIGPVAPMMIRGWADRRANRTPQADVQRSISLTPISLSVFEPTAITITTVSWPFSWDHPGEPVSEENLWTLSCKGRLTETDTPTIWLGTTPYGLTSAHLHHPPLFLQAGCPSCHPTNSVKAFKATSAFGLERRH